MAEQPPPARLLLIRHAQAQFDVQYGGGLTPLGSEQSQLLAGFLDSSGVDASFTSPAIRTIATVEAFTPEAQIDTRLAEFDFGPGWLPLEDAVATEAHLALWRARDRPAGGESLYEFQLRVNAILDELAATHTGRTVAVFTHAGVIDAALRWAYGIPADADWVTEADVRNASITELEHWSGGKQAGGAPRHMVLYRVGDVAFLPPGLRTDY